MMASLDLRMTLINYRLKRISSQGGERGAGRGSAGTLKQGFLPRRAGLQVLLQHQYLHYCLPHIYINLLKIGYTNLTRSVGVDLSNDSMMYEYKKSLEEGFSIAALDNEGKVLGVRIGVILRR